MNRLIKIFIVNYFPSLDFLWVNVVSNKKSDTVLSTFEIYFTNSSRLRRHRKIDDALNIKVADFNKCKQL